MGDQEQTDRSILNSETDEEFSKDLIRARALAEIFKGVEQVRANSTLKELEYADKANERQFASAQEERKARERWFASLNRRWWALFVLISLITSAFLVFAGWLISSDDPVKVARGWDIIKVVGSLIVGFFGGWGYKAAKTN